MENAWNMTHREFHLLVDVRNQLRTISKRSTTFTREKVDDLEEHLRKLGIEV